MKTQISRDSFQPDKRYTGIHQQQGRILTDADWNELVAICREQLKQMFIDVVGNGSPRIGALSITADRRIQPGNLYVGGLRAELPGNISLAANTQTDLPGYPTLPATGPYLVYADVWERTVTSLEDAKLRDPGLHGADTCTRTQTMLQVKACPESINFEEDLPHRGDATLELTLHTSMEINDPCDPCVVFMSESKGRVGNYLFRLEVHAVEGAASNPSRLILKWSCENGAEQYEVLPVEQMPPGFVSDNFVYEFHNLTTEKHLGVFLAFSNFNPTRGVIRTSYEIPNAQLPRDWVRRWDGYCELRHSGAVWNLEAGVDRGVDLSTGIAATAPGHVTLGGSLQINLEGLQLVLDLSGKTFVAGDFWLVPVREAVDGPGSTVLSGAEPAGIEHHYLRLALVQADGTVVPYGDDADQRRHRFPPLTDLRAHDVGYQTTCASGLFNTTQDTVEKALDRLCQLAAEHIAYTATCAAGLYAGFSGTVQQALDMICAIQASHVGFAKPCDTSLYQGRTIATVDDALKLLCEIQAGHISYKPGGDCTFLNQPGINTVQDALDVLCARPLGGGCRITVGKGGHYSTLQEALDDLLERAERDICLCLLPGNHEIRGQLLRPNVRGVNLCLAGCGTGTLLYVRDEPVRFQEFASVYLSEMKIVTIPGRQHEGHIITHVPEPPGALAFDRCTEVALKDLAIYGYIYYGSLVSVTFARKVIMKGLLLEASGPNSLELHTPFFKDTILFDLYKNHDFEIFKQESTRVAQEVGALSGEERDSLRYFISPRVREMINILSAREMLAYYELFSLLENSVSPEELAGAFERIRVEAVRQRPAVAIAINDSIADWTLSDCDILGILVLYGSQPAESLADHLTRELDELIKSERVGFYDYGGTEFRISSCRISQINLSASNLKYLQGLAQNGGGTLFMLFSRAQLNDLTLWRGWNQLLFTSVSLSSAIFEAKRGQAAMLVANSSIYVGNRTEGEVTIRNLTPSKRSERAANLGIVFSD